MYKIKRFQENDKYSLPIEILPWKYREETIHSNIYEEFKKGEIILLQKAGELKEEYVETYGSLSHEIKKIYKLLTDTPYSFIITKTKDDYFFVKVLIEKRITYYKCDQIGGVLSLIKFCKDWHYETTK
jgi:hypothetical protein